MGGKTPCLREGVRQKRAVFHLFADAFDVRRQLGVGQPLRQQIERFQDRQAGAHQRHELLVEDQEFFEIDLRFSRAPHRDARDLAALLDGVDQEALLRVAVAQFLFGAGFGHLLVHLSARIGVFEDEFRHYWLTSPETSVAPAGIWNLNWAIFDGRIQFLVCRTGR